MSYYDVFISYSVKNSDTAFQLVDCLEQHGLKCWIAPRNIKEGSAWAEEISDAIDHADNFVVIYSKESEASHQVPKEIGLASGAGKRMIPFVIDHTDLKGIFKYYLSDCQIVDASEQITAKMESLAESLEKLQDSVERMKSKQAEEASLAVKRKRWKVGIFLCMAAAVAVIAAVLYSILADEYRKYDSSLETIIFTANEDMTIKGFEADRDLLFGRMEELFGSDIEMEEDAEHFRAKITLPAIETAGLDMDLLIKEYLTIPGEFYLANAENEFKDFIKLPRDEIESVKLKDGMLAELALSVPGEENTDGYRYLELTLSDYLAEKVDNMLKEWKFVCLMSDVELANRSNTITEDGAIINDSYYCGDIAAVYDNGKRICFCPSEGNEKLDKLMEHILCTEPMTQCFETYYSVPVCWETKKDSLAYGVYQKQADQLKGAVTDVVYTCWEEGGLSEGEWMDVRKEWKRRLDCLEIPYAFGTGIQGHQTVTVRFLLEDINGELLRLISEDKLSTSGWWVRVNGLPESLERCDFTDFTYSRQSDGTYTAAMNIADASTGARLSLAEAEHVEISVNSNFLGAFVPVISGNASGGIVHFSATPLEGDGKMTEKAKPFLDMLTYLVNEAGTLPYLYHEDRVVMRSLKDMERFSARVFQYGLSYDMVAWNLAGLKAKIQENSELSEVVISISMEFDGDCTVYMNVKTGDAFVEDVVSYTKYLLRECIDDNCNRVSLHFTQEADEERARIVYDKMLKMNETEVWEYEYGEMSQEIHMCCYFGGERIDRHRERLKKAFVEDEYLSRLGFYFPEL